MRIKRFIAPDMRTALRMVRDEQGPDAVILSNRATDEGILQCHSFGSSSPKVRYCYTYFNSISMSY